MKAASYGRIVFGASAVLFGVIGLIWHDADTWQNLPIVKLPAVVGDVLAIVQIAAGVGLLILRTMRPASVALAAVYAIFCLACIPGIAARPATYGSYVLFFEIFSMACGAVALYAPGPATRIGFGICTVSFALAQVLYLKFTASLVPAWILPSQMFWAILTTVAFALAAIAMLANLRARLALRLTALMIAIFGLLVWVPAVVTHPEQHGNWSEFALNFLIMGAAGIVAESREK